MLQQFATLWASVIALGTAFHLLERRFPAERGQRFEHWLANFLYAPFMLAFTFLTVRAFAPLFNQVIASSGGGLIPMFGGPGSDLAAQLLFALLYAFVWDLAQYAMHRAQHAVPALWETHRFHHDETALNSMTQARTHPTNLVLATLFHVPVVVLFGPQVPHFIATFVMFRLSGFVNHANLRVGWGPAAILLSSPQWHRLHHSALAEHRDRNFATFFPVIDWLFGTYTAPRRGEYPPTGVGNARRAGLGEAMVRPFAVWSGMIRDLFRAGGARGVG